MTIAGQLFPVDPQDCDHPRWNPDNRQCLDCGDIDPSDLPKPDVPYVHILDQPFYATRHRAGEIREQIEAAAAADRKVVIDFSAVESATLGFLDELVCNLAAVRTVTVRGMNEDVADSIGVVIGRRELTHKVTSA